MKNVPGAVGKGGNKHDKQKAIFLHTVKGAQGIALPSLL